MMKAIGFVLYIIGLGLYKLILYLAAPFHAKASQMISGRRGAFKSIKTFTEKDQRTRIWFHCASLGEFEQIRPLIERYKSEKPDIAIVLTFFSPSGYEIRKKYPLADCITYLPFDSAGHAKRWVNLIKPTQVFFAKYDLWYFYLKELHAQKIKTFLIAANFRKDQVYFKEYGTFFYQILRYFTHIFSQFDASTNLLHQHGIDAASTSGDTRFDRVAALTTKSQPMPLMEQFKGNNRVGILGSSYTQEEIIACETAMHFKGKVKWIIAPHQITRERIQQIRDTFQGFNTCCFSESDARTAADAEILILDTIGHLGNAYWYADFALVGGGFRNQGIHNILEPLAQGAPVWFGPNNHEKFPETKLALQFGVAQILNDSGELSQWIEKMVFNEQLISDLHSACRTFIQTRQGATAKIWKHLEYSK